MVYGLYAFKIVKERGSEMNIEKSVINGIISMIKLKSMVISKFKLFHKRP